MRKPYSVLTAALLAGAMFLSSVPPVSAEEVIEPAEELPPLDLGVGITPFTDAKGTRYAVAVQFLYNNGIARGISETRFGVDEPIKRVDAAMIIGTYMAIDYIFPDAPRAAFRDLPTRAVKIVSALKEAGIVNGKTDTYFGSDLQITRGEAAIMLYNAFKPELKESDQPLTFTDVTGRYEEPVRALAEAGIIQGKTERQFGTHDPLTRGQLALFMYGSYLYERGGLDHSIRHKTRFIAFGDNNTSGAYFEDQYPEYQSNKWTDQVAAVYSRELARNMYNAGVSGDDTNEGMKRFREEVLALYPDSAAIMFGMNDALLLPNGQPQVSKAQFEKNITSMVTQLKERNVKVLLMTNPPVHEELYYEFHREQNAEQLYADKGGIRNWINSYNDIIRKVAKEQEVVLVDNYANAIAKAGGDTDAHIAKSGLVDDLIGIHWSPRGNSMIAYSVKHYLSKN
ncbi:S-layer homology domain-containing protein [Bacillus thermotolerans]|uniref:SLH domain-containing protein n=1 Tax=Bacillus thermotolerans TaxID=1221996 RepID=A0A0F5HN79_BACTR|nr:S-layer homology domain-containing protein [Bacillus thermotolerans]KKB34500.1 hypothetical protein QY95_03851 [Bacillus thermotolerans]